MPKWGKGGYVMWLCLGSSYLFLVRSDDVSSLQTLGSYEYIRSIASDEVTWLSSKTNTSRTSGGGAEPTSSKFVFGVTKEISLGKGA